MGFRSRIPTDTLLVKGESFERTINSNARYENGTSQLVGIKLRSWMTVKMNPFVSFFVLILFFDFFKFNLLIRSPESFFKIFFAIVDCDAN